MVMYREEYNGYLEEAKLLDFVKFFQHLPKLNHGLLSAMIDRFSPNTNTFHFPWGEMTPTLQDVEIIPRLPIDGNPIVANMTAKNCSTFEDLLQVEIPRKQNKVTNYVLAIWLRDKFRDLPEGASPDVIKRYAMAYTLCLLECALFSNKTAGRVHFHILQLLSEGHIAGEYSWGSAMLAYLYRELRDASLARGSGGRKGKVGVGGCLIFLQIWFWMRVPLGKVEPPFHSRGCAKWSDLKNFKVPKRSYLQHILDIESTNSEEICWQPYQVLNENNENEAELFRNKDLWRSKTDLVYFDISEPHNVHRVNKQFGEDKFQLAFEKSTVRRKKRGKNNLNRENRRDVKKWNNRLQHVPAQSSTQADDQKYKDYLHWLHESSFVKFTSYLTEGMPQYSIAERFQGQVNNIIETVEDGIGSCSGCRSNCTAMQQLEKILEDLKDFKDKSGIFPIQVNVEVKESSSDEEDSEERSRSERSRNDATEDSGETETNNKRKRKRSSAHHKQHGTEDRSSDGRSDDRSSDGTEASD